MREIEHDCQAGLRAHLTVNLKWDQLAWIYFSPVFFSCFKLDGKLALMRAFFFFFFKPKYSFFF